MYGYHISKKGGIEIDLYQAKIVKEIFARVIQGDSLNSIARWLNRNDLYGVLGGKWKTPRLRDLIRNDCREMADILGDTASLDKKIEAAQKEMNDVAALNSAFILSHVSAEKADEFAKKQQNMMKGIKKRRQGLQNTSRNEKSISPGARQSFPSLTLFSANR